MHSDFELAVQLVRDALVKLLLKEPVLGYFAKTTDIYVVSSDDERCKSSLGWTDGKAIYVCSSVATLSNPLGAATYVIAHEAMHMVLQHVERARQYAGELSPELINIVADAVVNERISHIPATGLPIVKCKDLELTLGIDEDTCREKSLEELLGMVRMNKHRISMSAISKLSRSVHSWDIVQPSSEGRQSDESKDKNREGQGKGSEGNQGKNGSSNSSRKDGEGKQSDRNSGSGNNGRQQQGRIEKVNEGTDASPQSRFAEAVFVASMTAAGTIPGWAKRIVDELLKPRVNWRSILRQYLSQGMRVKRTWSRESRKIEGVPGKTLYGKPRIAVLVDVSGSITDRQFAEFLSELLGILGEASRVDVIFWDTEVKAVRTVKHKSEIPRLEAQGGGGTMIREALEHAVKADYDEIIIMSDWDIADLDDPAVRAMLERNKHKIVAVTVGSKPPAFLRRRVKLE
ncbi:MAG: VWA-like domain-containing protein [Thermofilum sp.]